MKRWLIGILAALLLLSGCDGEPAPETTETQPRQTTVETTPPPGPSLYVADSLIEKNTGGAVRVFAPDNGNLLAYGFMGDDPVLFAATNEETTCAIRIDSATGEILAQGELTGDAINVWTGLVMGQNRLACFDMGEDCVRIFDDGFHELHKVPIPDEISGSVLVSSDLGTAYYTTGSELRALDLDTGIPRLILKLEDTDIFLNWLLFDDTVISCYISNPYESYQGFFSAADGRSLGRDEGLVNIESQDDRYLLSRTDGPATEILLGTYDGALQSFQADESYNSFRLLPYSGHMVTNLSEETGMGLHLYTSDRGNRVAQILLKDVWWVYDFREDAAGGVWFIATDPETEQDVLCRWDPSSGDGADTVVRVGKRSTAEDPDLEGLAQCQLRAQELEARFGVELYLHTEPLEPYDYAFTYEYQVRVIQDSLDELEALMEKFPEGFFETAASVTESGKLHIGLVREMEGTEYNTVADAVGLQYWIEGDAYIALLAQSGIGQNFCHELSHALDTYVYANSIHYDFWDDNNPEGFDYDYCYTEYENHWDSPYLHDDTRAFIDAYSMTYAHEDRARILEYAMMEWNEHYFATETMQAKLRQLCLGIREAFGWKKYEGTFIWEQYLQESLAYTRKK